MLTAISKSVGILSDPQQRRRFDEFGIEDEHQSVHYRRPGRNGNDYSDYDNGKDLLVFTICSGVTFTFQ